MIQWKRENQNCNDADVSENEDGKKSNSGHSGTPANESESNPFKFEFLSDEEDDNVAGPSGVESKS